MMNICGVQQNGFSNHEEMRKSSVVVCPKPLRVGVDNHHPARSVRCESNPRSEILDFILAKAGGCEQDPSRTATPSPPLFFSGSPPSRVPNPLAKNSLFRDEVLVAAPLPSTRRVAKPSSPRNGDGGGCVRATNLRNNPAVRVVGFDCLDRDRRRSVPTLA